MDIADVKQNLNKQVIFDGSPYILSGCMLRKGEIGFYYLAELHDVKARSVLVVKLESVAECT